MKKSIYLAAPLFNEQERAFNKIIQNYLDDLYEVHLPQEDGLLLADLLHNGYDIHTAQNKIFEADISAMNKCDILLAVLNGACIDEGVAFEIGYMYALKKQCFRLQTDIRRQLPSGNNPMINGALLEIFNNLEEIKNHLQKNIHE